MSYVVTEACIRCKYTDCVAICPVDAFREGQTMLVIDPETCIDCGVCEPQCPVGAIAFDMQADPHWRELNRTYSRTWPAIRSPRPPPADAGAFRSLSGKYDRYFDGTPAS
ncbi:ferredoxin family protein [Ramlibacter tataouinensis]|uniref:ferredoxin FdxA n=1 Tax=Ramlibacter tataouinensis TaxID=94132 RepID=UPI0022F3B0AE|nr:ferredoxin FdxA [Ramlibacter tataouinensis]WBX99915.1 ferredoxin family protein [Ramlibacter tataouinensis]